MMTKTLSTKIKILFLFISLLYGFVPFEASSFDKSFQIHTFFLILIMLYAFYSNNFKISKYSAIFFTTMIFIMSILFFISYGRSIYPLVVSLLFVSFVTPAIYNNPSFKYQFTQALLILIITSVFMVFLQTFIFFMTNNILLIHEFVFPFSQARIGEEVQYNNLTRMGGMYIEPGTYSNYMFILLTLYMLLKKKLASTLIFFTAISMILTYSLWGMIFAGYLLVLVSFVNIIKLPWKSKLFLLIALIFIALYGISTLKNSDMVQFGIEKMTRNSQEGSTASKKQAYEVYLNTFEDFFIIGDGFAPKIRNEVSNIQDAGLLLNISVVFGVIFTLILLAMYITFFLILADYTILLASVPLFLSKLFYWDPGIWLLFFMLIYGYIVRNTSNKENN